MTRALVVGGAGFVGTAACKELMRRGVETVAAGRRPRPYGVFTSFRAFDRRDSGQLSAVLAEVRPDVLLDLAAAQPGDVLRAIDRFEGDRYVLVGCEELLVEEALAAGAVVVRPGAVIGPDDPTLRMGAYLERIDGGGPLMVPEETFEQPAALAWVRDAGYVCALASDLRHDRTGRFDVAFEDVSLRRLLEAAANAMNRPLSLAPVPSASLAEGASPYTTLPAGFNLERTRQVLGFRPSSVEEALAETLAWYSVHRARRP